MAFKMKIYVYGYWLDQACHINDLCYTAPFCKIVFKTAFILKWLWAVS